MHERGQHSIENQTKVFAHILRQESQYEISVLSQGIFATIPAVRFGVGQVLRAVQLDDDASTQQEIHALNSLWLFCLSAHAASSCRAAPPGRDQALGFVAVRENWPSLYG